MKLALVLPGPLDRRSGGYSYDLDWCGHLRSLGHDVAVWSLPARSPHRELRRRLVSETPELVVFDALVHRPLVGWLERNIGLKTVPWLALVHHLAWLEDPEPTGATPGKKARERRFLALMDAFLFNSENTRQTVSDLRGPGAPFRPSLVNRPPVAPVLPGEKSSSAEARLLFLANLTPRKNLHGLVRALGLLATRRPDLRWRLTVAGNPDFDRAYTRLCHRLVGELGLGDRVAWVGRLEGQALDRAWAATDLLAVPSFHEGWGMVYAEALVRGIVPLTGNQGGGAEAVGRVGLLVDPRSPLEISRALEGFLDHRDQGLADRARSRGEFLTQAIFPGLEAFLLSVAVPPPPPRPFDFDAYLEAKASVDTRALHPGVAEAAFAGIRVESVVELGGGTGTMARRLRDWNLIDRETRYELVDERAEGLKLAQALGRDRFAPGAFTTRQADLNDLFGEAASTRPDLVVAHAVLDLFDAGPAARGLARLGARRYWLTHIFDGMTAWEPRLDPDLDESILLAYHRTMDERGRLGGEGSSRSGRAWLEALPAAGFHILAAGSSDWIVRPENGAYPAKEKVFLDSLLHFFRSSLTGRAGVDQAGLAWWLGRRQTQIDRGEVTFLAHQLDIAAEGPER